MKYLKNIVSLKLNSDLCTGCGLCIVVCPHTVFEIQNKKAIITNIDKCMECGACAINCEFGALTVKSGVGCAAVIINGILKGTEPTCDCACSDKEETLCC